MRIWDVNPKCLCRKHLLAEHRELHGLWNILTTHKGKGGYSKHPETLRWVGKRKALYARHEALVKEFLKRGYQHNSPLNKKFATGSKKQTTLLQSVREQKHILKHKPCVCPL
ncbi:MAG: pyrimidine dimer DNA glycosylase/endonuclease V [Patescibacteria group bacterium]|nr:pyrimidine dimer DNA glycosylase/endonuclease V [Patescibacteria group bacterium]